MAELLVMYLVNCNLPDFGRRQIETHIY